MIKEHKDACMKCLKDKSVIAEHAMTNHGQIRTMQLVLKQLLSICMTLDLGRTLALIETAGMSCPDSNNVMHDTRRWVQLEQHPC